MMHRIFRPRLVVTFALILAARAVLLAAPDVIRRDGWSYDRADFLASAEKIAAAKSARGGVRLAGWVEFDVNVAKSGWYELLIGGITPEWPRDLYVDGALIYRLGRATAADALPNAAAHGVQFKDTDLYLSAGSHTLRFRRQREPGAQPGVWELRPSASGDDAAAIRVEVAGPRIVDPGEPVMLRVTGGGTGRASTYTLFLRDEVADVVSATPCATVAFSASVKPETRDVPVTLAGHGLYTIIARSGDHELRPSEFKVGRLLATKGAGSARPINFAPPVSGKSPLLAAPFCNGAVLQRDKPLPVWGWAAPGDKITVTFAGQTAAAIAGADGLWRATLAPMEASSAPGELEVIAVSSKTGAETQRQKITDVLIGEVWLLSGQSNMGGSLNTSTGGLERARAADYPDVRMAMIHGSKTERQLAGASWISAVSHGDPKNMERWVAIHYAFGADLREKLGVPIGLVSANRGGTCISTWTGLDTHRAEPAFAPLLANYEEGIAENLPEILHLENIASYLNAWKKKGRPDPGPKLAAPRFNNNAPAFCYRELIEPLAPFAIRGVLWYQGEADGNAAAAYRSRFPAMIRDWRALWSDAALPFIFAQISYSGGKPANIAPGDTGQGEVREAQTLALSVPRTAMIATIDLMTPSDDVHYKNKLPVGHRFARAALSSVYGFKNIAASGPCYKSMTVENGAIRLLFDHAAGLKTNNGGAPGGFAIAGADKKWAWADARIEGDCIVVSSQKISKPVAVRHGWSAYPCGTNVINGDDLPLPTFRTDDWPMLTAGKFGFELR
ncbi:sialate O-acetylesterase [Ereboglobus luteus]|uniref:Sialate O-acetylesterase domain-containing protein n=1 Tax=Ereboglobus luteus TaxID=1796921 RepID=A0A2U8DZV6_9BACT|nr:sialate O-acetylesterase [Ereboglobus luteus]AWI08137.1 hypothetical protein CKA38_01655 [Ereboglobus luteus]